LTGEAGLESVSKYALYGLCELTGGYRRIRSLETSVSDIRQAQLHMQDTLNEVLSTLRGGSVPPRAQPYPSYHMQQSPVHSSPSVGSIPTPTPSHAQVMDTSHGMPPPGSYPSSSHSIASLLSSGHRPDVYRTPVAVQAQSNAHISPSSSGYPHGDQNSSGSNHLPPISAFPQQGQPVTQHHHQQGAHSHAPGVSSSLKRPGLIVSTTTSGSSSDVEDDDGELTQRGMVAPFEVLRSLADVAVRQDKIVRGHQSVPIRSHRTHTPQEKITDSAPPSRARTPPVSGKQGRPAKRRKLAQPIARAPSFPDGRFSKRTRALYVDVGYSGVEKHYQ
jgi:hypothetical protein